MRKVKQSESTETPVGASVSAATRDLALAALLEAHLAAVHASEPYSTHHVDHHLRVRDTCLYIGSRMDADLHVLEPAALLHDIGRLQEGPGCCHAAISADIADRLLADQGVETMRRIRICAAIRAHRYSAGVVPDSLEGRILQDADRLDALGAIGIVRVVTHGASQFFYDPAAPFPDTRPPSPSLTLDHFFDKILKLKDGLHTPIARQLAESRHVFIQSFLTQLRRELLISL